MTESIFYCTREDVKSATDVVSTSRVDAVIDRAIAAASRYIEGQTLRRFYPWDGTRTFDWPIPVARWWILELEDNELTSATLVVSGGVPMTQDVDYFLRPDNAPALRAPFTRVEINLAGNGSFNIGSSIQRAILITGTFGYNNELAAVGTLAAAAGSGDAQVTLSSGFGWGIGSILVVDNERLVVTGRQSVTTGQTVGTGGLTALNSATLVPVASTGAFTIGEIILIDGEKMLITDTAGTNLIVERGWDATPLAAHTAGTTIYSNRQATVRRAALGTTAAAHSQNAAVNLVVIPDGIKEWCLAKAITDTADVLAAYARYVGRGGKAIPYVRGVGVAELAENAMAAYGRGPRMGVAL